MTDFPGLLQALQRGQVRFIVIGGAAATGHGSARLTLDIDVVYSRTPENQRRLAAAIGTLAPRLRGAPEGLPFVWDERTIKSGLNFTLSTSLGAIDLLGEVAGGGTYENLEKDTETIHVFGVDCLCVTLDALIRLKRAAGRRKDLEAIAELEAIREEREKTGLR
jgi:predicted nucleotidyltransferase